RGSAPPGGGDRTETPGRRAGPGKGCGALVLTRRLRALVADPRTWAFALVIGLLLVSIPAYQLIPPTHFGWGFDLRNVYVFHACSGKNDPYLVTGAQCGDPIGRAMPYPPLMYWALAWMRWVSLDTARWIWASFIAVVLLWAAW